MELALVIALALVVIIGTYERREFIKLVRRTDEGYLAHIAQMESEHQAERRELMNRVQRPSHMPVPVRPRTRERERPEQPTQRIGTIMAPKASE